MIDFNNYLVINSPSRPKRVFIESGKLILIQNEGGRLPEGYGGDYMEPEVEEIDLPPGTWAIVTMTEEDARMVVEEPYSRFLGEGITIDLWYRNYTYDYQNYLKSTYSLDTALESLHSLEGSLGYNNPVWLKLKK